MFVGGAKILVFHKKEENKISRKKRDISFGWIIYNGY